MHIVKEHITIKNEELILTNQRALYWQREHALILSDVHIGKTAHFRKHGIPMPDEILQRDLQRLKELIDHFTPHRLYIVGDLFHAERNSDITTFKSWLQQFPELKIILIQGNHDRQSNSLMDDLNIKVLSKLEINPFTFIHDISEIQTDNFKISGHLHPGILLKGKGKQSLKLPCYQITKHQLILPAFSLFTGLYTKDIPQDAIVYAFTDASIFKF
ncbi:MAG: ligase-associated DNA damage response endonuclease PdeM [Winogradskyella sp.]